MTNAQDLMATLNNALGGDILKMGSDDQFKVTHIPTGLLPIDVLLHGGVPRGRFTEVFGDSSTLKSYIGLCAMAQTQKAGGTAAIIDTEHSFDPDWATDAGVDVSRLLLVQPETGELAIDAAEVMIRNNVDLIVFDSIAATLPQQEQTKRMHGENIQPARLASLMSAACRRLTAANSKTAVFWINQTRMNVGITFGNPEVTAGGRAMPYYASARINLKKVGKINDDKKVYNGEKWITSKVQVGQKYKATTVKSKLSKPFEEVFFDWDMTKGQVDLTGYIIAQLVESGAIQITGNTWTFGEHKAVGRAKFRALVDDDPDLLAAMTVHARTVHGLDRDKPKTKKRTPRKPQPK